MKKYLAILLFAFLILLFTACENGDVPDISSTPVGDLPTSYPWGNADSKEQTDSPWVQTECFRKGWAYREIDLSEGKYIPSNKDSRNYKDREIDAFGYEAGTYEHDYFVCLTGLSYYAAVADYRIFEDYLNDDQLVDVFFESYADPFLFQEPYASLMLNLCYVLREADFQMMELDYSMMTAYGSSVNYDYADYTYHISEWNSRLALLFANLDTEIRDHAEKLLSLSEVYPAYEGTFLLSETMKDALEEVIGACGFIKDRREKLLPKWGEYYESRIPEVDVKMELIKSRATIKITLISEGNSFVFGDNYRYWVKDSMYTRNPTQSPAVIYMPMDYYYQNDCFLDVRVRDRFGNEFDMNRYEAFDFEAWGEEKGKPVEISDPFLDAAFTAEFGEGYTDIDLCQVKYLFVHYENRAVAFDDEGDYDEPTIKMTYYDTEKGQENGVSVYFYSEFFDEPYTGEFPHDIKFDIMKIQCLRDVWFGRFSKYKIFTIGELNSFLHESYLYAFTADDYLYYKEEE